MPKHDMHFKAGQSLPEKLKAFMKDYFSEKDFEKLYKFGGRVQISLTAPFTDRAIQDSDLLIDEDFIATLKKNPTKADDILKNLTKKQLVAVAKLLNFPTTAKATTKEIKKTINDFLKSADKWDKISNK
jgi:hypothetical protein